MDSQPTGESRVVNEFYARHDLERAIMTTLRDSGVDVDALVVEDLAQVDQYHTGGAASTNMLLSLAGLPRGGHLLDVGGGMGGAARTLAKSLDCRVTVLDLTEEFCRVGSYLNERVGLAEQVSFKVGNALDMPFPDAHFDGAWMQNASMNISDKSRLFNEIFRVLKPEARLALQ
jgi:ubiquinone/menaquinone biosynthesis C-methylase UbiE